MAEAFSNHLANGRAKAISAGTIPSGSVNITVVEAMRQVGLDISHNRPRALTPEMIQKADRVINMGCMGSAACPARFVLSQDWGLPDRTTSLWYKFVKIRDELKQKVEALVNSMGI